MANIKNALSVTRGDTLSVDVSITDADGAPYALQDGDMLVLTVKRTTAVDEPVVIQKTNDAKSGTHFELTPGETEVDYGEYRYDIELTQANGRRFTVVKPSVLNVTEEVTTHGSA